MPERSATDGVRWTGIGGLPFADRQNAIAYVFDRYPRLPFLPQLVTQSGEGSMLRAVLPADIDILDGGFGVRLALDGQDPELAKRFAPDTDRLLGSSLMRLLADDLATVGATRSPRALKMQMAGPLTVLHVVRDVRGVPLIGHPHLHAPIERWFGALTAAVATRLRTGAAETTLFLDEPAMGLAGVDGAGTDAWATIASCLTAIRSAGVLTGIHCCSDPPLERLFDLRADLLAVDVVRFGEAVLAAAEGVEAFLYRGGRLVAGVVGVLPVDEDRSPTPFLRALASRMPGLAERDLVRSVVLSPTCGSMLAPETREYELSAKLAEFAAELDAIAGDGVA